jgi:hypothetical protein
MEAGRPGEGKRRLERKTFQPSVAEQFIQSRRESTGWPWEIGRGPPAAEKAPVYEVERTVFAGRTCGAEGSERHIQIVDH